jgi:GxxExxY protein
MPAYAKADLIRSLAEEVHRELGAGHLESVYHKAMEVQFRLLNLAYETERVMDLKFKDHFVGTIRADIILLKECVLEFKISGKMDDAVQQARQYMKLQGLSYGFVVLFPKTDGATVQMVDARLPSAIEA